MAMDVGAGQGGKKGRGVPEMNVTPLVDVVLVLLIIFMVVMPMLSESFWVHVPRLQTEEQPATEPEAGDEPPIVVTVTAQGAIRVNQDAFSDREFPLRLRRMLIAQGERKIYFDAHDDAPFERAVEVMDLARGGGAAHIAVMTEQLR